MATASTLPPNSGNDRFNAEAAAWDRNPGVVKASELAFAAIESRFPALKKVGETARTSGLDVLELGCGTGLLTTLIAPHARTIVAVDAAPGMIAALASKVAHNPQTLGNVRPLCLMLEDPEDPALPSASEDAEGTRLKLKYDLILSQLVLHHVADLDGLLQTMLGCLKKGGSISLTDFENFGPGARRFHALSRMAGVERDGIEKQAMEEIMNRAG